MYIGLRKAQNITSVRGQEQGAKLHRLRDQLEGGVDAHQH